MPTELHDDSGESMRQRAGEFGTTTGRPRRCGWFDGVAARYGVIVNDLTSGILTRLDILDGMNPVKVCVGYEVDGKPIDGFPAQINALEKCKPIYRDFAGWTKPTAGLTNWDDVPEEAKQYVQGLEEVIGCPLDVISTGPHRHETISRKVLIP